MPARPAWADGRRHRPPPAGGVLFLVVYRQVLATPCRSRAGRRSGAITAAGAQLATEQFVARGETRGGDVGFAYAWSTAATIDPRPEGKNFFPRIFDDVSQRTRRSTSSCSAGVKGEVGTEIADLLEKLSEGVEVRIIVDARGASRTGRRAADVPPARRRRRPDRRERHPSPGTRTGCTRTTGASTGRRTTSAAPTTASST